MFVARPGLCTSIGTTLGGAVDHSRSVTPPSEQRRSSTFPSAAAIGAPLLSPHERTRANDHEQNRDDSGVGQAEAIGTVREMQHADAVDGLRREGPRSDVLPLQVREMWAHGDQDVE